MTWIKICGTTNLEDAMVAVEAGADALGFVFYENSPRNVTPEVAREIIEKLPPEIEKVGVLPGASLSQCRDVADRCGFTAVQIYAALSMFAGSNHAIGLGATLKKIYLTFFISDLLDDEPRVNFDVSSIATMPYQENQIQNPFSTVILDSGTANNPGGTGKTFDWKAAVPLAANLRKGVKIVVAGGLNPGNVAEAVAILNPWGVDVVSGVEASPGKKDPEKVRAFISAVRQADKSK
jgi:phosphoribosylanthranilate isomerase